MYGEVPCWSETVHAITDSQPVEPSKGFCFRTVGIVKVLCRKEPRNDLKGWEQNAAVHLAEDVNKPEYGGMYVFKGLVEVSTDVKLMTEVCEKMEETL